MRTKRTHKAAAHHDYSYFAEWLNVTMENKGITGVALAKKLHVTEAAVSRWRHGAGRPGLHTVLRIADLLGADPLRLVVTAGYLSDNAVDTPPLDLPEPVVRHAHVRQRIAQIPELTDYERQYLLDTYEALTTGKKEAS